MHCKAKAFMIGRYKTGLRPLGQFPSTPGPHPAAYVLEGPDGVHRIHTRLLDQPEGVTLAGTEGAISRFFSPAGQRR